MSVYLSNKRCEVNKDGSRKGHIEVNAKAEVPLGYDGIIEYEVKKANGKVASGKCRITNNNGDVEVCGPDGCRFKASADNSGVVCEPISEVIDFIYNLGDELMFSALSGAIGNIKGLIDSGENGVPASDSSDAYKTLIVGEDGFTKWDEYAYKTQCDDKNSFGVPSKEVASNKYLAIKLCDVAAPKYTAGDGKVTRFHFDCVASIGKYNTAMRKALCSVTGSTSSSTQYPAHIGMACSYGNSTMVGYASRIASYAEYGMQLYIALQEHEDKSGTVWLYVKNTAANTGYLAVEISDVYWSDNVTNVYYGFNKHSSVKDSISESVSNQSLDYITVPACTTSDNGKVLKVVNGVPTWASA